MSEPSGIESFDRWKLCLALGVIAMLPFLSTLGAEFVFDDHNAVLRNVLVTGEFDLKAVFQRDFWGKAAGESVGSYRPLTVLSFIIDYRISGGAPWSFHLSNLVMHAATSTVLFIYLDARFGRRPAVLAALLFALHALHSENTAAIVARADVLSTLLVIATLWLARQKANWSWLAGISFFGALLAKEIAVAALALLLADLVLGLDANASASPRSRVQSLCAMTLAFVVYMVVRQAAMGLTEPPVLIQGNPLLGASGLERIYTCAAMFTRTVGLMLLPWTLIADYSIPAIMPEPSLWKADVLLGLLFALALPLLMVSQRKVRPAVAWGAALILAAYVPISNLLVLVPTIFAERLLYLPSVGFVIIFSHLFLALYAHKKHAAQRVLRLLLACYLGFHFVRASIRSTDWQSETDIFIAAVQSQPVSLLSRVQLGAAERAAGNLDAAALQYEKAIELAPNFGNPYTELGITLDLMDSPKQAHTLLRRALQVTPHCGECVAGLVNFYIKYGRFDAAENEILRLEQLSPDSKVISNSLRAQLLEVRAQYPAQ